MKQRGSIPLAVLIGLAVLILVVMGLAVCTDALFEDEDERNDLGAPALVVEKDKHSDDRDYSGDRDKGRNSRGDCDRSTSCSDDDFSPSFDKSPVQDSFNICLPGAECHWGEGETASLFKLDPVLLVKTIQEGATAIGTAAGTMAGAIAAFPIGILLAA